MLEKYNDNKVPAQAEDIFAVDNFWQKYEEAITTYKFEEAVQVINELVSKCDEAISEQKPWEKEKNGEDISSLLYQLAECLRHIAIALLPIIPEAAAKILKQLNTEEKSHDWGKLAENGIISKGDILFSRLNK